MAGPMRIPGFRRDVAAGTPAAGAPAADAAAAPPPASVEPFDRRVIIVGGVVFAVEMALSTRYGFHRDELYFLDCARHLQASYVDQPVLTPLLAWVSLKLFGVSLPGLRVWPALAAWATVLVAGLIAREFGGGRRAQLLAAVATATMPALLAIDHLAGPTAFDVLAWAGLAFVVARIGRTGDARWWLLGGVILGLGLANKHSVGFFGLAVFAGALLSGGRRLVLNRWFLAGFLIAAAFTIPDIWWQAQHGWATIAMTRRLNQENGGLGNIPSWIIGQLIMSAVALVAVWLIGLRSLWRSGRPLWKALAWAYGLLFVFFMLTSGSKIYYLAGAYIYLLAAGAVAIDGWLAAKPGRFRNLLIATGVTTAVALPLTLPVLPAGQHRLDVHGQPGTGRVHRLAAAGQHGPRRVAVAAAQPAGPRGDLHRRIRRGRGHRQPGPGHRPADRGQRAEHLLVVGTGQAPGDHGGGGGPRADGRHRLR